MSSKIKSESGQVMVLAAGAMILILGFAALAVDVGFLYATRRNMQTAADAAAIAGANALQASLTCDSSSCPAAQDVATLNGYTNGGPNGTIVTVGPPATPPSPSTGTYVEVDVTQTVPTYFMRALGLATVNVTTHAIAGFVATPNCIVTLAASDNNALVVSGGSALSAPNCNVVVDSSSTSGLVVSGGSTLTASSVGVAPSSETQAGSGVTPPYVPNSPVVTDPLSNLAVPPQCSSSGGCSGAACTKTNFTSNTSQTIGPGVYCGGIKVSSGTLTLTAGTYILIGGNGLDVSSNSASIVGSGVTFYNTFNGTNAYKEIGIKGGGSANLSAPTSGTYKGILFYQDRHAELPPCSCNHQETISGGSNVTLQGTLYFPNAPLYFSGGSSATPNNVTLVVWDLNISGTSTYIGSGTSAPTETTGISTTKLYD